MPSRKVVLARRLRRSMTPQEVKVWNWIRDRLHPLGWKFRRQVPIGPYVVDFACLRPRLAIEIDGDSHGTDEGRRRDAVRDAWLRERGFEVLRIVNSEIGDGPERFLDVFRARFGDDDPDRLRRSRGRPPDAGSG